MKLSLKELKRFSKYDIWGTISISMFIREKLVLSKVVSEYLDQYSYDDNEFDYTPWISMSGIDQQVRIPLVLILDYETK